MLTFRNNSLPRDLIKAYRACTTQSEERALVKKEAAHIRDLFREGDKAFRRQNIAKLLFFHMNGYPTDFGMTECIKLCASNKYNDKRVAYLGLMILVDETVEVLMLMTNCLQQDLHSEDLHIISLALNVLGDIASEEMVRDLLPYIERHLLSPNPYIRKKASLAAVRAVRKLSQEETANILRGAPVVFDLRSSAVHISATALVNALCKQSRTNVTILQPVVVPIILNLLRDHLLLPNNRGGAVVGSVRNPFLQVKLLYTLRIVLEPGASVELLESASDILAQVLANTNNAKIAGCAVLYECVRTIMSLSVDKSLRTLSATILGNFLGHREPTVRYIALQELTRVVDIDGLGVLAKVDGYKERVMGALREADSTMRKRALELVFRICNESNITEVVGELLGYIEKSTAVEQKQDACWKIFILLDRFGPSDEWKVETFVKTLSCADTATPEELITSFLAFVSSKPNIQTHAVFQVFSEALASTSPGMKQSKDTDPFFSGQIDGVEGGSQDAPKSSSSRPRKPRLERVALYVLGEYGETAPQAGLQISQVLDAFDKLLQTSANADEPWMNTLEGGYSEENKILGEIALTGLIKFAQRAIGGTEEAAPAHDPVLAITSGQDSDVDPLGSILAITAPQSHQPQDQKGLGTDLLADLGLSDDRQNQGDDGANNALVPAFNSLTVQDAGHSGHLMSLQSDVMASSGNPVVDRVRQILLLRAQDTDLEMQQRACEYLMLLNETLLPLLATAMAPMPPMDFHKVQERAKHRKEMRSSTTVAEVSGDEGGGSLFDLLGDSTGPGEPPPSLPAPGDDLLALPAAPFSSVPASLTLEDVMGEGMNAMQENKGVAGRGGLLDNATMPEMALAAAATVDAPLPNVEEVSGTKKGSLLTSTIFGSAWMCVVADFYRDNSAQRGNIRAELVFTNKSSFMMRKFAFLLSVPKYIELCMQPASSSEIPIGGQATQTVNLINSLDGQRPIQLRYRVEYVDASSGEFVQQQGMAKGLDAL